MYLLPGTLLLWMCMLYLSIPQSSVAVESLCPQQCLNQVQSIAAALKAHNESSSMCGSIFLGIHGAFLAIGPESVSIVKDSEGTWFRAVASNCLLCASELIAAGVATQHPQSNIIANLNETFTNWIDIRASLRGGNAIVSLNVSRGNTLGEAIIIQGLLPPGYSPSPNNSIILNQDRSIPRRCHRHPEFFKGSGEGYLEVKVVWLNSVATKEDNFVDTYLGGIGRGGQGSFIPLCDSLCNLWGSPMSLADIDMLSGLPSGSITAPPTRECLSVDDFLSPGSWKLVNRNEYCERSFGGAKNA